MQTTIKGKTAGGILKTAQVAQMRAGNWEVVVTAPHQCIAMIGDRADGWGGRIADVLLLSDTTGLVARLKMSAAALQKMTRLESQCEANQAKYA